MLNTSLKTGRFTKILFRKKSLLFFWFLSVGTLLLQTVVITLSIKSDFLELTNVLEAETSSSSILAVNESIQRATFSIWFFSLIIIAIAVWLSIVFARKLSWPYTTFLEKTEQIDKGALSVKISPLGNYELDQLALVINRLTQQLADQIETSDQRIAERTRALETVVRSLKSTTDITHQITTILEIDELLQYIVDNIQKAFQFYHVHIYLVEDDGQTLMMAHGSGDVGRQLKAQAHQMQLGQGIVGTVAQANQYFLSNDVDKTPNFVRNPLLPDTRAELAVPLRKGEQVLGVLDIQTRRIDRFELQDLALIQSVANQTAVAVENARLFEKITEAHAEIKILNEQLKEENLRMGAELDVARQLQCMLLPREEEILQIEDVDIATFMKPADEVGGDYYDVLKHNGTVKIGIGDVTGHGLESGVVMLMLQTAIRTILNSDEKDPVRFMDILNRTLYDNFERMNVSKSLTLALFDYQSGQMRLSGQHEHVIVVRRDGQVELKDTLDLGLPLALDRDIAPFVNETVIDLQPGDGVVLYSDGFTEAENESGEFYGLKPLCEVASQHWAQPAETIKDHIVADVRQFIGQQTVYDDLTLVVVKQR